MSSSLPWECDICEEPRHSAQMIKCAECNSFVGRCHGRATAGTATCGPYTIARGVCSLCQLK